MSNSKMVEVIIDLDLDVYTQLKKIADDKGITVEKLASDIITEYVELERAKGQASVIVTEDDYNDLVSARDIVIDHFENIDPDLNPWPKWGLDNLISQYEQYQLVKPFDDANLAISLRLKRDADAYARIEYYEGEDLNELSREDFRNLISILCGQLASAKTIYSLEK